MDKQTTLVNQLAKMMESAKHALRLVEMDKLEFYLKGKGIPYVRVDNEDGICPRHQIMTNCVDDKWDWDVICHKGSYGYMDGLLELSGNLVNYDDDGDSVVGYLTAQDVIDRIERKEKES